MKIFRKRKVIYEDPIEIRFDSMMTLVKDLSKKDYGRLKEAMDLGWMSYQKIRNVKTDEEREVEDITKSERLLESEENK